MPQKQLKDTNKYIKLEKQEKQRIFVQTPQAIYIPIAQKFEENVFQYLRKQETFAQQRKPKKISIFDEHLGSQVKQKQQKSTLSLFNLQKKPQQSSQVVKSKTSISFKKQRISQFFYYQNYIVCKGMRKVIVYNFFSRTVTHIPVKFDQFVLKSFPPYVFNCITGQYLNLYTEDSVEKYAQVHRRREQTFKKKKTYQTNYNKSEKEDDDLNYDKEKQAISAIQVVVVKISKLEVECICQHSQVYYMGGYNRSILPGGKKSERRQIYLMQHLDPKINNKPKQIIKLQSSNFPVSLIQVQMPYLIVYCRPNFYFFSLKSHQLLLTFQKQLKSSILLEGRLALSVINGIGISSRSPKQTIFTYDVENTPIYGVEITQHKQQATCLCMEKTGRVFGCHKMALFEYIPTKRVTRCVKLYPEGQTILWIESTPSNSLLVLRQDQNLQYKIQAFSVDQNSIGDY